MSVSNIALTILGHGYIGEAREVLADMHSQIFDSLAPDDRFGLRRESNDQANHSG